MKNIDEAYQKLALAKAVSATSTSSTSSTGPAGGTTTASTATGSTAANTGTTSTTTPVGQSSGTPSSGGGISSTGGSGGKGGSAVSGSSGTAGTTNPPSGKDGGNAGIPPSNIPPGTNNGITAGKLPTKHKPTNRPARKDCSKAKYLYGQREQHKRDNGITALDMDSDMFNDYASNHKLFDSNNDMSLRNINDFNKLSDAEYVQLVSYLRQWILYGKKNSKINISDIKRIISVSKLNNQSRLLLNGLNRQNIKYLLIEQNDNITKPLGLSNGKIVYACIGRQNNKFKIPIGFVESPSEFALEFNENLLYQISSIDYNENQGLTHVKLNNLKRDPRFRVANEGIIISNKRDLQVQYVTDFNDNNGNPVSNTKRFVSRNRGRAFVGLCDDKFNDMNDINEYMKLVYEGNAIKDIVDPRHIRLASLQRKIPIKDLIRLQCALFNIMRNPTNYRNARNNNQKSNQAVEILKRVMNGDSKYQWFENLLKKYMEDYDVSKAIDQPASYTFSPQFDLLNSVRMDSMMTALFKLYNTTKSDNTKNIISRGFNNFLTNFAAATNNLSPRETRSLVVTYRPDDNEKNNKMIIVQYATEKDPDTGRNYIVLKYFNDISSSAPFDTNKVQPWNFNLNDFIQTLNKNGIPVNDNTLDKISFESMLWQQMESEMNGKLRRDNSNMVTGMLFQDIIPDSQAIDRFNKPTQNAQPLNDADYNAFLDELTRLTNFKHGVFVNINIANTDFNDAAAMSFNTSAYDELYVALPENGVISSLFDINVANNKWNDSEIAKWKSSKSSVVVNNGPLNPVNTNTTNSGSENKRVIKKNDIINAIERFKTDNNIGNSITINNLIQKIQEKSTEDFNETTITEIQAITSLYNVFFDIQYNFDDGTVSVTSIKDSKSKMKVNDITAILNHILPQIGATNNLYLANKIYDSIWSNDIVEFLNILKTLPVMEQNGVTVDNNGISYVHDLQRVSLNIDSVRDRIMDNTFWLKNITPSALNKSDVINIINNYLKDNAMKADSVSDIEYKNDFDGTYILCNAKIGAYNYKIKMSSPIDIQYEDNTAATNIGNNINAIRQALLQYAKNELSYEDDTTRELQLNLTDHIINNYVINKENVDNLDPTTADLIALALDDDSFIKKIQPFIDNSNESSTKKCTISSWKNLNDIPLSL